FADGEVLRTAEADVAVRAELGNGCAEVKRIDRGHLHVAGVLTEARGEAGIGKIVVLCGAFGGDAGANVLLRSRVSGAEAEAAAVEVVGAEDRRVGGIAADR